MTILNDGFYSLQGRVSTHLFERLALGQVSPFTIVSVSPG